MSNLIAHFKGQNNMCYYNKCDRTDFGLHLHPYLQKLKDNSLSELIVDVRNNFLYCEIHYDLKDTYVSLEDNILVTKYNDDYILIDCNDYTPGYNIFDYLSGFVSLQDMLNVYRFSVYHCTLFINHLRPTFKIIL